MELQWRDRSGFTPDSLFSCRTASTFVAQLTHQHDCAYNTMDLFVEDMVIGNEKTLRTATSRTAVRAYIV